MQLVEVTKNAGRSSGEWVSAARELLIREHTGSGWGYGRQAAACVEPTVLGSFALMGLVSGASGASIAACVKSSADWVAGRQEECGAVPNSGDSAGRWATPYAILLWRAVGGYQESRARAVDWLLARRGRSFARDPRSPIGHDTSLVGWPWIEDTHSWLEPTALAVVALCSEGRGKHARTREGVRLIQDRSIRAGGWNYGNNVVFGRELRPRPAPTGIALLALAASGCDGPAVDRACRYLEQTLPEIRSAQSLCWGLLGLGAWGQRPAEAGRWLAEAFERSRRRGDGPCQTAYLLLACSEHAHWALGIQGEGS